MERGFAILPRQSGTKPMETAPDSKPGKPALSCSLRSTFAALRLPVVLVIAAVYMVVSLRIPTGEDAEKAYHFQRVLVKQLGLTGLPDLDIKVSPRSRGRGDIILKTPVSPEKLDLIRREFDRLNVAGDYELKVRAP
mgnify:FL=1